MEYVERFNEILVQVPIGIAVLLALIGIASYFLMFTKFGKSRKGIAVCIPGFLVGSVGAMSWMSRLLGY